MKPLLDAKRLRKTVPLLVLAAAVLLAYAPSALGFSSGMNSEASGFPSNFDEVGCTACHGGDSFAQTANKIAFNVTDQEGNEVTSGAYEHDATYIINILLRNPQADPSGFHLSASAGEFEALPDTNVQITGGGTEASHTNPGGTQWSVQWTAPASGAVAFRVLVNDANGDGSADAGDNVYRMFFGLTDEEGAQLGAQVEEEVHFGVSLPQYWLGLIALASMALVILFSFVYLKFVNPHSTDSKDR